MTALDANLSVLPFDELPDESVGVVHFVRYM
jgi:hypothetical protein